MRKVVVLLLNIFILSNWLPIFFRLDYSREHGYRMMTLPIQILFALSFAIAGIIWLVKRKKGDSKEFATVFFSLSPLFLILSLFIICAIIGIYPGE